MSGLARIIEECIIEMHDYIRVRVIVPVRARICVYVCVNDGVCV